eukprot:SAG31_NODE_1353_length_8663_cov_6.353690_8_plen_115_part_00
MLANGWPSVLPHEKPALLISRSTHSPAPCDRVSSPRRRWAAQNANEDGRVGGETRGHFLADVFFADACEEALNDALAIIFEREGGLNLDDPAFDVQLFDVPWMLGWRWATMELR